MNRQIPYLRDGMTTAPDDPPRGSAARARAMAAVVCMTLAALLNFAPPTAAQDDLSDVLPIRDLSQFPRLNGQSLDSLSTEKPVKIEARFTAGDQGRPPMLYVTATIAAKYHIYSITQPAGGPTPTTIRLDETPGVSPPGAFTALQPPRRHIDDIAFKGVPVEEHYRTVTWESPLLFAAGVDPADLVIRGDVTVQACTDSLCLLPEALPFEAKLSREDVAVGGQYRAKDSNVVIRAFLEPAVATPGDKVKLIISAAPDAGWHIYARQDSDPVEVGMGKPTLIAIDPPRGFTAYRPETDAKVYERQSEMPGGGVERYHKGAVTWTSTIKIPADAAVGEYPVEGLVGYQVCLDTACQTPQGARFSGVVTVAAAPQMGTTPLVLTAATYGEAATAVKPLPLSPASGGYTWADLALYLGAALLGGLILNLMPCVLPVIGLKVLSFVEQAGHDRAKILALNLWYSAGMLAVFLVLATLAAFFNLGWGEQFTQLWFKVALAGLVFAMALSFLGVWELPIPGFATSGAATEWAAREGASGAFSKGMFTTILATPCSGPFLGSVFGFTLDKPPHLIYLIFTAVGLGMALPYLLIGAIPDLIRFLPKPGAWMETFKQAMAFLLLGTVVFLFSTIDEAYFIASLTFLVGLWLGCWWIGRTPATASASTQWTAWIGGVGSAALVGMFAFTVLAGEGEDLPWRPYAPATLAAAQADGKTVLVDFTADWCGTCKWNLATAINTREVRRLVAEHQVVPLMADWTDYSETVKTALAELGSKSIPVLAIYPADRPGEVIVLRDLVTQGQVLAALEKAGPSRPEGPATAGPSRPSGSPTGPNVMAKP